MKEGNTGAKEKIKMNRAETVKRFQREKLG